MTENPIIPKSNPTLLGHETQLSSLWADYESGKLAHGWLISGPRGIGKATLAYHFARGLLSGELEMDDSNPIFQRILADSHTDFRVIEPEYDPKKEEFAREISVEQAREIAQFMRLTPGESNWRVVIVDSIDQLNVNAANAILKILEEPPAQAILMLISHNPGKLLPPSARAAGRSASIHWRKKLSRGCCVRMPLTSTAVSLQRWPSCRIFRPAWRWSWRGKGRWICMQKFLK
ncbi:MAG: AAA family ATPase [Alphaproteobacteria bacterium]|nr:AAA family ATPase [Alphaproteobacteria bacterium]